MTTRHVLLEVEREEQEKEREQQQGGGEDHEASRKVHE
jgi:hypothetical protein